MIRSKLHISSIMEWFKSRHRASTMENYLNLPEQIEYIQTLEKLFQEFDNDNSGSLDKEELLEMFNKYGIKITQDEMNAFFAQVDKNNDRSLNIDEFKKCISDEKANKFFTKMMLNLRKREQIHPSITQETAESTRNSQNQNLLNRRFSNLLKQKTKVLKQDLLEIAPPLTFKKVLNQISYMEKKEKLMSNLGSQAKQMDDKVKSLKKLIELSSQIEVQMNYRNGVLYKEERKCQSHDREDYPDMKLKKEIQQLVSRAQQQGSEDAYELIRLKNNKINVRPQTQLDSLTLRKFKKLENFRHEKDQYFIKFHSNFNQLNDNFNDYAASKPNLKIKSFVISKSLEKLDNQIFQRIKNKSYLKQVKQLNHLFLKNHITSLKVNEYRHNLNEAKSQLNTNISEFSKYLNQQIDTISNAPQSNIQVDNTQQESTKNSTSPFGVKSFQLNFDQQQQLSQKIQMTKILIPQTSKPKSRLHRYITQQSESFIPKIKSISPNDEISIRKKAVTPFDYHSK